MAKTKEPKIVHIYFKNTDEHEYYSSIVAAYQQHDAADLGLQYRSLVNALHDNAKYENKRIVARVGRIKSSPSKQSSCNESN